MDNNSETNTHTYTDIAKVKNERIERLKNANKQRWASFECDMSNEEFRELTGGYSLGLIAELLGVKKNQIQTYTRLKNPARVPKKLSDKLKIILQDKITVQNTKDARDKRGNKLDYPKVSIETFNTLTQGLKAREIANKLGFQVSRILAWRSRKIDIPLRYAQQFSTKPIDDSLIIYEPACKPRVKKPYVNVYENVAQITNKEFRKLVEGYPLEEMAEYIGIAVDKLQGWLRTGKNGGGRPRKIHKVYNERIYNYVAFKRTGIDPQQAKNSVKPQYGRPHINNDKETYILTKSIYTELKMNNENMIVLADFESEEEYKAIKGKTAFESLAKHRIVLNNAKLEYEAKGYTVILETCDLNGYKEFLEKNNIVNTPQNVASYVIAKHTDLLKKSFDMLQHQNIEIIED